jgi:hypothetical protein
MEACSVSPTLLDPIDAGTTKRMTLCRLIFVAGMFGSNGADDHDGLGALPYNDEDTVDMLAK